MGNTIENIPELKNNTIKLLEKYNRNLDIASNDNSVSLTKSRLINRDIYAGNGFITTGNKFTDNEYTINPNSSIWPGKSNSMANNVNFKNVMGMGFADWTGNNKLPHSYPSAHIEGDILHLEGSLNSYNKTYKEFSWSLPEAYDVPYIREIHNTNFDIKKGITFVDGDLTSNRNDSISDYYIEPGCSFEEDMTDDGSGGVMSTGDYKYTMVDNSKKHAVYCKIDKSNPLYINSTYSLTFSISEISGNINNIHVNIYGYGTVAIDHTKTQIVEIFFNPKSNYNGNRIYINMSADNGAYIKISEPILRLVEPTPLVSKIDIPTGSNFVLDHNLRNNLIIHSTISRHDLIFIEKWTEDVKLRDIVYPFGNTQFNNSNFTIDGIDSSKLQLGDFSDSNFYSLYGDWQDPGAMVSYGYKWSNLTTEEKVKFMSDIRNNIFIDGKTIKQVRYRVRTIKALNVRHTLDSDNYDFIGYKEIPHRVTVRGDKLTYYKDHSEEYSETYNSRSDLPGGFISDDGKVAIIPIGYLQRLNNGIYHPTYNPEGTAIGIKPDNSLVRWWEDIDYIKTYKDCWDADKIAYKKSNGSYINKGDYNDDGVVTGRIETGITGRDDNKFSDNNMGNHFVNLIIDCNKYSNKEIMEKVTEAITTHSLRSTDKFVKQSLVLKDFKIQSRGINNTHKAPYITIEDKYGRNLGYLNNAFNKLNGYMINISKNSKSYIGWVDGSIYPTNNKDVALEYQNVNSVIGSYSINDKLMIIDSKVTDFIESYEKLNINIVGQILSLEDRTKYILDQADNHKGLNFIYGDVIKVTDTNGNNGVANHYYACIKRNGFNNIYHATTGTANVENGHIDVSDSSIWLDLGDNPDKGNLPSSWYNYGLPGEIIPGYNNTLLNSIKLDGSKGAMILPLGNPINSNAYYADLLRLYVLDTRTNTIEEIPKRVNWDQLSKQGTYKGWYVHHANHGVTCNILGTGNLEHEDLQFKVFIIVSTTNTRLGNPIKIKKPINYVDKVTKLVDTNFYNKQGDVRASYLNRYTKPNYQSTGIKTKLLTNSLLTVDKQLSAYSGSAPYVFTNEPFTLINPSINASIIKYVKMLTNVNNVAYLNILFKELRVDNNHNLMDDGMFQVVENDGLITYTNTVLNPDNSLSLYGINEMRLPYFINN